MDAKEFGRRFKAARLVTGYSQGEAARRMGIFRPRISEIEAGASIPHLPRLMEMIDLLGLDPRILFPEFFPVKKR